MDYDDGSASPLAGETPLPDVAASHETPHGKPKRQRKTIEQQIADTEQRLKKLKQRARSEERKARTHRLVTSAATIEAEAGHVELDETMARWLGQALAAELEKPESEIARHVSARASREVGGAE